MTVEDPRRDYNPAKRRFEARAIPYSDHELGHVIRRKFLSDTLGTCREADDEAIQGGFGQQLAKAKQALEQLKLGYERRGYTSIELSAMLNTTIGAMRR